MPSRAVPGVSNVGRGLLGREGRGWEGLSGEVEWAREWCTGEGMCVCRCVGVDVCVYVCMYVWETKGWERKRETQRKREGKRVERSSSIHQRRGAMDVGLVRWTMALGVCQGALHYLGVASPRSPLHPRLFQVVLLLCVQQGGQGSGRTKVQEVVERSAEGE